MGDVAQVVMEKSPDESCTYLSEIIGDESASGKMMPTGAVLDLMDLAAGRVAFNHVKGMVATVSFDHVELIMPVCHMDLVRVEGRLVSVGSSSLVVRVIAYKEDRHTRTFVKSTASYITMVALHKETLRPNKNIPKLKLEKEEDLQEEMKVKARKMLFTKWIEMQQQDAESILNANDVLDQSFHDNKREHLSIAQTQVEVRKQCLPRHLNPNQTLFGGDILIWMEQVATYTAKRFTGNEHMITLTMDRVSFTQPITMRDVLEMKAYVVYVRNYLLQVQVTAFVDKVGNRSDLKLSHTGFFEILNLDSLGFKRPIMTGINLNSATQEELHMYNNAKKRFYFQNDAKKLAQSKTQQNSSETKNRSFFFKKDDEL
mmetsp:Transcript_35592/g.36297  ORF Transcript_35592/g.36297 Transcript_35592/m.36297 type:complete len:372 (+) Transcript_35592:37-1152(+)|eukprot:CAMPEP_0182445138 /NCGR_PEP_ID=MMETSP1172-20130603/3369_1 /TAXON_ID=708627 /ORGANISM="Timspurckia oligopyrenoides, Strain CCMP3278" /LENGTH=371 /DNA_ID=CAMNT_0024640851 /DNA_START=203 /DNA_END=1318 /DNA_ORIENTATION=+